MKRRLALAFLCLISTALPAQANGNIGFKFDIHLRGAFNAWWGCNGCGIAPCGPGCGPGGMSVEGVAPLAPWYLYYPLEAQFQTPAPITYPFWPAPLVPPQPAPPPAVQRTGYYPAAPSYWYGR